MNKQPHNTKRRSYTASVLAATTIVALMGGSIWLLLWILESDPSAKPPLPVLALLIAIPSAVALGTVIALVLRIREINRNETEDAKRY